MYQDQRGPWDFPRIFELNNNSGDWSIITDRISFSTNDHRVLERHHHMVICMILFDSRHAFQFDGGKVGRSLSTSRQHFTSILSAITTKSKEKMVLKSSTKHCEVSIVLLCFPPALNFTFWNIISFAFRSRKAGRLKLPKSCRLSCIFFTFFLPQRAKVKGICLWRHCWRFKGHII